MCLDALQRDESCGGHFREEYQTEEGEALRNDDEYAYVAGWLYRGADKTPALAKESLQYENIKLAQRSYK
jgi:succinate dehydrogenase / fumarate reductase flavoprotein subunit